MHNTTATFALHNLMSIQLLSTHQRGYISIKPPGLGLVQGSLWPSNIKDVCKRRGFEEKIHHIGRNPKAQGSKVDLRNVLAHHRHKYSRQEQPSYHSAAACGRAACHSECLVISTIEKKSRFPSCIRVESNAKKVHNFPDDIEKHISSLFLFYFC